MFRYRNRALLLLTMRVHVLSDTCNNSRTCTGEATKTNDNMQEQSDLHKRDHENKRQPQTFTTVEGQKFANRFIDNTAADAKRKRSVEQRTPPPFPRYSMLTRRRVCWICEISSLRTASDRSPHNRPTLNLGERGVCSKQHPTSNAQIIGLRTFVLQQSPLIGSSIN